MNISVHLVTWNGAKWLPGFFASLRSIKNMKLLVLDNGSADNSVEIIRRELQTVPFSHRLIELKENTGFARGHNRLFAETTAKAGLAAAEAVLIVNQDIVFESDCI